VDGVDTKPTWWGWGTENISLPEVYEKSPKDMLIYPSWGLVRPVQVGTREEDIGTTDDVGSDIIRHGIPMADMLNKRKHVGVLIEGQEAPDTLLAMASAARHMPALKSMEDFTAEEDTRLKKLVAKANTAFDKYINEPRSSLRKSWEKKNLKEYPKLSNIGVLGVLKASSLTMKESEEFKDSNMHLVQCHKKILDCDVQTISLDMAKELANNQWVLAGKVSGEKLVNGIGNLRFDIIIDTTGRVHDNPKHMWENNPPV